MLDLQNIVKKAQKDLLEEEKTELRKNVRNLTKEQQKKFAEILAVSDPNMGENEVVPTDKPNIPEEQ